MKRQSKAYLFAISAVLCWSTVATAFKLTLEQLSIVSMLFYASLSSFLFLLVVLLIQGKGKAILGVKTKSKLRAVLLGAMNPFVYYLILFKAYSLLPAQEAQTLNYTWAVMLVILSAFFLKQKMKWADFVGVLISFLGVVVISTHGQVLDMHFENPMGVILALSTAIIWASYWILNSKGQEDAVVKLFWNFFFGTILITVYALFFSQGIELNGFGILGAIYIGFFEMGVSFVFWSLAMKYTSNAAKISNLIFLSPFLSLLIISAVLNERILGSTVVGLVFIIGGILFQKIASRRLNR